MAAANRSTGLTLTDTDILIDAARGLSDAVTFLHAQKASSGLQVSIISAMELVIGCSNRRELGQVRQFLRRSTIFPLSRSVSLTAYQLVESFYLSHGLLIPDALIAATALEHKLVLYTRNTRHFQMIPSLKLAQPYK